MASSREPAVTVLFDANFLMTAARLHFDVFKQVEVVLDSTFEAKILATNLTELSGLAKYSNPVTRKQARVAVKLAEFCSVVKPTATEQDPDDSIVEYATTHPQTIVATNDGALRLRLRRVGSPVIFLRGGGKLDFSGYEA